MLVRTLPQVDRRDLEVPKFPSNDFEFGLYTGTFATQNFGSSWVYGAKIGYHITEDFFVEGVYGQTNVSDELFRQILPGGVFPKEKEKLSYYNLSIGYNLLPGEIFIGGRRARPSQFYLVAGVGSTKFADQRRPTVNVGFGYRVYLADWAALQLDLRHDPVFDHPRDDAPEMVACRSAHGRFWLDISRRLRHEACELPPIHDALATGRPDGGQPAAIGQPAHAVDTDSEQLRDLADLVGGHIQDGPTLAFAGFRHKIPRIIGP